VILASRALSRVVPHVIGAKDLPGIVLLTLRATAIARFATKYPYRAIAPAAGTAAAGVAYAVSKAARSRGPKANPAAFEVANAAAAAANAAYNAHADTIATADAYADAYVAFANDAVRYTISAGYDASVDTDDQDASPYAAAVLVDARRLHEKVITVEQLARSQLWPISAPLEVAHALQRLTVELHALGSHWKVWTDWYQNVVLQEPHRQIIEAEDAAFTDLPSELPWDLGAEAVNTEIGQRLAELSFQAELSEIPDQSPAPVRVEERDGKVAKATDRDSALSATERDFKAWRDPVVDHIDELTASDFAAGTNHSRVRDRLTALSKLLPGEIAQVKEQQFRIGYEMERFEGLVAAYRSGSEDMPMLYAAQMEDLDRLRVALKMGIDKLERWSEFRKQANESTAGEADADRGTVGDALDEMASVMEQHSKYFDPELPATFRFLSEAVRDPRGATKTVVYGAIKSAENVVSFLGQRALGIGKKGIEAVETHISKAIAASLVAGLGGAALGLSGALSQGWAWLKPLLAALAAG
jgi:hypothetical protein